MASNEDGSIGRTSGAMSHPNEPQPSNNSALSQASTSSGNGTPAESPNTSNVPSRRHKRRNAPLHSSSHSSNQIGLVPGIFTGVPGSLVDKDSEFLCPICFEIYREAHMTKCGHSFCHECILKSMEQSPRCPKCNYQLETKESLFPNFILDELVAKHNRKLDSEKLLSSGTPTKITKFATMGISDDLIRPMTEDLLNKFDSDGNPNSEKKKMVARAEMLELKDIDSMIKLLTEKRFQMEADACLTEHTLLQDFLTHLKRLKDDQLIQLKRETGVIQSDLEKITNLIKDIKVQSCDRFTENIHADRRDADDLHEINAANISSGIPGDFTFDQDRYGPNDSVEGASNTNIAVVPTTEGFNVFPNKKHIFKTTLPQRRQRMNTHFEDLASCYFSMRASQMAFPANEECSNQDLEDQPKFNGLDEFSSCLAKFTRYSKLHPLATLSYTTDIFNNASIVSSIEFDKDNELFAIAGVTKRIKVYDYNVVLKDIVDIHYPTIEMVCGSKISCISWNSFHKSTLASSDYDCSVIVWDANTAQRVRTFQEHEKRCWSVDFNSVDTKLLASGSDDSRVKLWSANINHSVATLEAKANVCCVKFNPTSCYHLAFGSADHFVHYYDLRNSKTPLNVFRGHKKAVSYVKFFNSTDIISASTDGQLKLWNVNQKNCIRSFTGHINEKNFVGLATDGDYMTCGSENNGLYIYYKGLSKPLFNFKFDSVRSLLDRDRKEGDTTNEFVSAVCWRQNSPIILAANSQGTIKVLELV